MRQELMEIANGDQIEHEIARRFKSIINFEFKSSPIRCFNARSVIIIAGSSAPLSIKISGFGESFWGRQLACCNTNNPENLEVSMDERGMVLQSSKDPDFFFVFGSVTSISGPKYSDAAEDLDAPAEDLKVLPKRDPDIVQIDNQTYRQTGTVYISGRFYIIITER